MAGQSLDRLVPIGRTRLADICPGGISMFRLIIALALAAHGIGHSMGILPSPRNDLRDRSVPGGDSARNRDLGVLHCQRSRLVDA